MNIKITAPLLLFTIGHVASRFVPTIKVTNLSTLAAKKAITARDISLKPLVIEECMRQVYEFGFMMAELQTIGNISTCFGVAQSATPAYKLAKQSVVGKCASSDKKCMGSTDFELFEHQRPHIDHYTIKSGWTDTNAENATLCEKQINELNWQFGFGDNSQAARAFWWHRENDGTHCIALDAVEMVPSAHSTWALAAPPQWDAELVKTVDCKEFLRKYPDFELAFKSGAAKCSRSEIHVSRLQPDHQFGSKKLIW